MKLILAAIAPRQAVVEPKDCVSGLSSALLGGSWREKRTFEFPILGLASLLHARDLAARLWPLLAGAPDAVLIALGGGTTLIKGDATL